MGVHGQSEGWLGWVRVRARFWNGVRARARVRVGARVRVRVRVRVRARGARA